MSDPEREKGRGAKPVQAFSLVLQLGINMLVPLFVCFLLGSFIYKKTGILWPLIVLIVIGIAAGFNGCWRLVKRMFLDDAGADTNGGH